MSSFLSVREVKQTDDTPAVWGAANIPHADDEHAGGETLMLELKLFLVPGLQRYFLEAAQRA